MRNIIRGVIPPLITPLNDRGELDETGLRKLVSYCMIKLEAQVVRP